MFNVGAGEAAVIGLVAVIVLGPERLPRAAQEVGRVLRHLRGVAQDAKAELRAELGPDVDTIRSLDPRRMIRDELFGDGNRLSGDGPATGSVASSAAVGPPPWDPDAT